MGTRLGVTCTDGEVWVEQRNFVLRHLRRSGYGRQPMELQIQSELNELIEVIAENEGKPVWPGSFLPASVLNVLWTFTAGKRIERNDKSLNSLLEIMRERGKAFDVSGGWLNAMPFLRFIAPDATKYNLIKHINVELQNFFKPIIAQHKADFTPDKTDDDLIYAFINEMRLAEGKPTNFTELQLTMVILDMFIAGSHTTSNTIDFLLIYLTLNPEIQKRCHTEIDKILGKAELPALSDKSKLSYIEAVILETQRMANIIPLGGPRRVLKDTKLGGYIIPKNTTVLTGLEIIYMDKDYWGDPETFRPERFLDENNKICNTERCVGFAQGKRKCLGELLARAALLTYTVGILQKFSLELPPNGEKPSLVPNIGIVKSTKPYKIVFRQR